MILPIIYIIFKSKNRNIIAKAIAIFMSIAILIFLTFKKLRQFFLPPNIPSEKIVGYAQYFGYPFYFDTLLVSTLFILPVVIFLTLKFLKLDKNK